MGLKDEAALNLSSGTAQAPKGRGHPNSPDPPKLLKLCLLPHKVELGPHGKEAGRAGCSPGLHVSVTLTRVSSALGSKEPLTLANLRVGSHIHFWRGGSIAYNSFPKGPVTLQKVKNHPCRVMGLGSRGGHLSGSGQFAR